MQAEQNSVLLFEKRLSKKIQCFEQEKTMINYYNIHLPFLISMLLSICVTAQHSAIDNGRQIFQKGTSLNGTKVIANMSGIEIPASVLPCASCHGKDGKGKPEGGVTPSNITWTALTANYEGKRTIGRTYPAYTTQTIKRAISMGIDPAGNKLNNAMPKYAMTQADMNDLIAYLEVLEKEATIGISDTSIHIGWLPLLEHKYPAIDGVQKNLVKAFFEEINQNGGIYSRKIYLKTFPINEVKKSNTTPQEKDQAVFALTGSSLFGNYELTKPINTGGIPILSAIAPYPSNGIFNKKSTFFLYPNLKEQVEALANLINTPKIFGEHFTILIEKGTVRQELLETFLDKGNSSFTVTTIDSTSKNFKKIFNNWQQNRVKSVFLLVSKEMEEDFFAQMLAEQLSLDVLLLGTYTKTNIFDLPSYFDNRILLAYPSWTTSYAQKGRVLYQQLQQKYKLSKRFHQSQMAALATVILLTEALKSCGKGLTIDSFIKQVESFYKFQTGCAPPVTFTINRHTGSKEIFMLRYQGQKEGLRLIQNLSDVNK